MIELEWAFRASSILQECVCGPQKNALGNQIQADWLVMDTGKVLLIICLTIVGVIVLNAVLYLALRRRQEVNAITLLRRAAGRARDPWKDEADALDELSQLVAGLEQAQKEAASTLDDDEKISTNR